MEDNLTLVIVVIFSVLLLLFMPLFNSFERQDDMAYEFALSSVIRLNDDVMQSGYLSRDRYTQFFNELESTGNTYKVDMEAHKKMFNRLNDDEVVLNYDIDYTRQIMKQIECPYINNKESSIKSAAYLFNEGDYFFTKIRNTNITQATIFFQAIGGRRDYVKIKINYGGIVKANEWKDADKTKIDTINIPKTPKLIAFPDVINNAIYEGATDITFTVSPEEKDVHHYIWTVMDKKGNIEKTTGTNTFKKFYKEGEYVLKVQAFNKDGLESNENVAGFRIVNQAVIDEGILNTGFTATESIVVPGTSILSYKYSVTIGKEHYAERDKYKVEAHVIGAPDDEYELIVEKPTTNGIILKPGVEKYVPIAPDKYDKLRFTYYVTPGHESCLSEDSKIQYSVKYKVIN
ncbi:MAG: hypothetical protein RR702_06340 [Clostridia bacterium]